MHAKISNYAESEAIIPEILYKYRNGAKIEHMALLINQELFFAPHSSFGCEYEYNLEIDFESVTVDDLRERFNNDAIERNIKDERRRKIFVEKHISNTNFFDKEHQKEIEKKVKDEFDNTVGILSMSARLDSDWLWDIFGEGRTGFCAGFSRRILRAENGDLNFAAGPVEYYPEDNQPKLKALCSSFDERLQNQNIQIYSLPDIYRNEEEYRLIKRNANGSDLDDEDRKVKFDSDDLLEVILGVNMSNDKEKEIVEIVKNNYPKTIIYKELNDNGVIIRKIV